MDARRVRVPFKQQMTDSDCGPACLAMILATYGHDTSVYKTRTVCEEIGLPQSLRTILAAGRKFGLNGSMVAADLDAIPQLAVPAIIHWNFQHYVVFEGIRKGSYDIVDPAMGRRRVSPQEFSESFTGIAATFEPNSSFARQRNPRNPAFGAYVKAALTQPAVLRLLANTLLLALVLQGISFLAPGLTVYLIDVVMAGNATSIHRALLPLILCGILSIGAVTYLRSVSIALLQSMVDEALLSGFVQHVLQLPSRFFQDKSVGDIQSRMNSSTVVRDMTSSYAVSVLLDVVMGFGYLAVLYALAPTFGAFACAMVAVQLAVYLLQIGWMRDKIAAEIKTQATYQAYVYELLTGMLTVKAASAEGEVRRVWQTKLRNYLTAAKDRSLSDASFDALITSLRMGTPALLLWFSVLQFFDHEMTLGTVLAINTIGAMAITPLGSLVGIVRQWQLLRTHLERMSDVWLHNPEPEGAVPSPPLASCGRIELKSVSFSYKNSDRPALANLTMSIPLGSKVGIVGPSGSGKSTIVGLLMGFHEPNSGSISINGTPLTDLSMRSFRERVGLVSQQTFLFSSSIRRNVSLGKPSSALVDIEFAAEAAGLGEMIRSNPLGIDACVGNDGGNISGGQRQRMAIARALLKQPEMLILDEATSSLDSATEQIIANAIAARSGTQVIISHRLSTVDKCDIIYVIENGSVTASGSHMQLLATSEFYRSCVSAQTRASTSDMDAERILKVAP